MKGAMFNTVCFFKVTSCKCHQIKSAILNFGLISSFDLKPICIQFTANTSELTLSLQNF